MATGIVVCWFVCLFVTRGARGRPQSVGLLPEARVGGHGYSSMLVVCLSVCLSQVYLLRHSTAFTAWIAFTQQYLGLSSGRF